MRHGKKINHLGRKYGHREAMLSNMAASLIRHKRIFTTTAKAKELRGYIEPLITRAKDDTTHSRRIVFGYLQDKESVKELFSTVAEKIADRPGGYTRILKTGSRKGDNAEMCMMELVDFNELMLEQKESATTSTTKAKRTRRGKKKSTDTDEATPKATAKTEAKAKVEKAEEAAPKTEAKAEVESTEATEAPVEESPKAEDSNNTESEGEAEDKK